MGQVKSKEQTATHSIMVHPHECFSSDFSNNQIIKTNLDLSSVLPKNKAQEHTAFTLDHVFTEKECQDLIAFAESQGFTKVPVNYGDREAINEDIRTGFRVIADDEEFVDKLWERISSHVPKKVKGASVIKPNERLRILKYHKNHFFAPHMDGNYVRPYNRLETSLLTIQIYLNEDFEGGETTFLVEGRACKDKNSPRVPLKPRTGMLLIFDQDLMHEGSLVKDGIKYTIRTDIMYSYEKS